MILLGSSAKKEQQRAIERAKGTWAEFKGRKRAGSKSLGSNEWH